jgi:hypothetical protein
MVAKHDLIKKKKKHWLVAILTIQQVNIHNRLGQQTNDHITVGVLLINNLKKYIPIKG